MKMNEIMNHIARLALCQGYYGRLYHSIRELESTDYEAYTELVDELEGKNFPDVLSLVLYFEC